MVFCLSDNLYSLSLQFRTIAKIFTNLKVNLERSKFGYSTGISLSNKVAHNWTSISHKKPINVIVEVCQNLCQDGIANVFRPFSFLIASFTKYVRQRGIY